VPRIRSIKPEFWNDQELARLPRDVRMLYLALWNHCDEQSRMQGDPRLVKSWCFPLDDDVTAEVVNSWLDQLVACGKVVRYVENGCVYLHLPKLGNHQKLDPRLKSRYPEPPAQTPPTEINTDQPVRTSVSNTDVTPTEQVAGSREQVAGSREQVAGSRVAERGDADESRPDVDRICEHLADRIESNGSKRPIIGKRWREAARLMLDNDRYAEEQIHKAIDWCQNDDFWRSNILSMRKLRDKYETLRLQAARASPDVANRKQQHTDDLFDQAMVRALARDEESPP
jgi:hypothetical protein